MKLECQDCSPVGSELDGEQTAWISRLARSFKTSEHVLSFGQSRDPDEPVVSCDWDGTWRTGRYIGALRFEGTTMLIRPRLGLDTIRNWLCHVNNLQFVESPGVLSEDASFIVELVAKVWAHGLAGAARHGLPALRMGSFHIGNAVRGRLDVAQTVNRGTLHRQQLVSVRRERSLANPIARTLACAYNVLHRWMGAGRDREWLPQRCQELLPQVLSATGPRPELPTKAELSRIRYTPITQCYRRFVSFSWQIARQRGLFGDPEAEGQSNGLLLDVAELWELYVLSVLRSSVHPLVVYHGTGEDKGRDHLLTNAVDDGKLGDLRPDAVVVSDRGFRSIVDAKYKFLHRGPIREDLYQVAAYLSRFGELALSRGALIYPEDPCQPDPPWTESRNPWRMGTQGLVSFLTLPHDPKLAVTKLRAALSNCP